MFAAVMSRSAINLEVPITFVGLTALSEEVNSTRFTRARGLPGSRSGCR